MLLGELYNTATFVQKKAFRLYSNRVHYFAHQTWNIKAPLYTLMFKVFSSILGKALSKETLFAIWVHYQVNVNGLVSELENGQDRIAL